MKAYGIILALLLMTPPAAAIDRAEVIGRAKAFQALKKLFLGHAVDAGIFGLAVLPDHRRRHVFDTDRGYRIGLRLIHFDIFLHRVNDGFIQIFRRYRLLRNLAQRDDRVLVIIALNRNRRSGCYCPCAMTCKKHQFKPVRNLVDTIFDGDACHD